MYILYVEDEGGIVLVGLVFDMWMECTGELTALQALDLLSKEDYTLIDVRSEKEKAKSGVPSLPRNAKNKFLPIPWVRLSTTSNI